MLNIGPQCSPDGGPAGGGDSSADANQKTVIIQGIREPVRLSLQEWMSSPWGATETAPRVTVERLQSFSQEISESRTSDSRLLFARDDPPRDILVNGPGFLETLVRLLPNLNAEQQSNLLDYACQTDLFFPLASKSSANLQAELNCLVYIGDCWQQIQHIEAEDLRDSLTHVLDCQLDHLCENLHVRQGTGGETAPNDPVLVLEDSLIDLARNNPEFERAVAWLLKGWKQRYVSAGPDLDYKRFRFASSYDAAADSLSNNEISELATEIMRYKEASSRLCRIMKPDGPEATRFNAAREMIRLLGAEGSSGLALRHFPFKTVAERDGMLHLIRRMTEELGPLDLVISEQSELADELSRIRQEQKKGISSHNAAALIVEYLTSDTQLSVFDYLEVSTGKRQDSLHVCHFLRDLAALRWERRSFEFVHAPEASSISADLLVVKKDCRNFADISKARDKAFTDCLLSKKWYRDNDEIKEVQFASLLADYRIMLAHDDAPRAQMRLAIMAAAAERAKISGSGPHGFCTVCPSTLEDLNKMAFRLLVVSNNNVDPKYKNDPDRVFWRPDLLVFTPED